MAERKHSPNNEAGDGRTQKSVGYNRAQITEKEPLKGDRNERKPRTVIRVDISTPIWENVYIQVAFNEISKYLE